MHSFPDEKNPPKMSMQQYTHTDPTYKRPLTCLSWTHRDVVAGYEDGTIKFFDPETGSLKSSDKAHTGIIWCFLFKPDSKKLFVGSNDSCMSVWYNERVIDFINFNSPIFSLCTYQGNKSGVETRGFHGGFLYPRVISTRGYFRGYLVVFSAKLAEKYRP